MCIYFLYINNNPSEDGYQIIAVNNRDEYYDRPTRPARFWNSHCISGVDAHPGKEGGTWFGVSSQGRIGALLNILELNPENNKKGRGSLVTDYLQGEKDALTYSSEIAEDKSNYNAFNLVLLEKREKQWSVIYTSALDDGSPRIFGSGYLAFGNSVYDKPWQKVVHGKDQFVEIVEKYGKNSRSVSERASLKSELLSLLKDKTRYIPDPQLKSQVSPTKIKLGFYDALSAKFVEVPVSRYGTRTHTILLIDADGKCEYTEVTMQEAVQDPVAWDSTTETFSLRCQL